MREARKAGVTRRGGVCTFLSLLGAIVVGRWKRDAHRTRDALHGFISSRKHHFRRGAARFTKGTIVMVTPQTGHRWASLNEAAAYVGLSRRTIEREIAAGHLTRHKLRHRVLVDLNELDALLVGRR